MRAAAWVALVALAVVAASSGQLALGLGVAALKTAIVGAEYMELRRADRLHGALLAIAIVALSVGLLAIAA